MPVAAPKPCVKCGVLVVGGGSRCPAHKVREGSFADRARGTSSERGYGAAWRRARELVLARDGGMCRCAECKQSGAVRLATEVDHIVNKAMWRQLHGSMAGVDDPANLQAINADCHRRKTGRETRGGAG